MTNTFALMHASSAIDLVRNLHPRRLVRKSPPLAKLHATNPKSQLIVPNCNFPLTRKTHGFCAHAPRPAGAAGPRRARATTTRGGAAGAESARANESNHGRHAGVTFEASPSRHVRRAGTGLTNFMLRRWRPPRRQAVDLAAAGSSCKTHTFSDAGRYPGASTGPEWNGWGGQHETMPIEYVLDSPPHLRLGSDGGARWVGEIVDQWSVGG